MQTQKKSWRDSLTQNRNEGAGRGQWRKHRTPKKKDNAKNESPRPKPPEHTAPKPPPETTKRPNAETKAADTDTLAQSKYLNFCVDQALDKLNGSGNTEAALDTFTGLIKRLPDLTAHPPIHKLLFKYRVEGKFRRPEQFEEALKALCV